MKKVRVEMSIIDNSKNETSINQTGNYDGIKGITFLDNNVLVKITIDNIIVIERRSEEYEMKLIFDENNMTKSSYIIYDPKMILEMLVDTIKIEKTNNSFYLKYKLNIDNEEIGVFSVDFRWEEAQ